MFVALKSKWKDGEVELVNKKKKEADVVLVVVKKTVFRGMFQIDVLMLLQMFVLL